jgi:hypothetical protein
MKVIPWLLVSGSWWCSVFLLEAVALVVPQPINPPVGPYVNLTDAHFAQSRSFATNDRVVLTPYFYWYDVKNGAHMIDADGTDALTDHPATLTNFSYTLPDWHKGELLDMIDAGIDVVLPVYWGEPSQRKTNQPVSAQPWSFAGLPPLVKAREELLSEGKQPPAIGLFYDTSTLQHNVANRRIDLTKPDGWQWFYESVRDFFSLIPPKHWAMVGGQPVVFLYASGFAERHDQSCIDYLRTAFRRDFGGRNPFLVREISWNVLSEGVYAWGGALGLRSMGVASLGPGYDHSAVQGRDPLVVSREQGQFFVRNWENFLRKPSLLVMIETWNEYHEGTDIAHSAEYGREYITLNRKYADLFKSGITLPRLPGPYTDARLLSIDLDITNREAGLIQRELADGATTVTNYEGSPCRVFAQTQYAGRYLYVKVEESFKWAPTMNVQVTVEFFDLGAGTLRLQYDGSDPQAPFQGAYTSSPETVALSGSRTWRKAVFTLKDARFLNLQNGGTDFRLESSRTGVGIRRIQMVRPGLSLQRYHPNEGCTLRLYASPGRSYSLESSSNLVHWSEIARLPLTQTTTDYLDTTAYQQGLRFYRAQKN